MLYTNFTTQPQTPEEVTPAANVTFAARGFELKRAAKETRKEMDMLSGTPPIVDVPLVTKSPASSQVRIIFVLSLGNKVKLVCSIQSI